MACIIAKYAYIESMSESYKRDGIAEKLLLDSRESVLLWVQSQIDYFMEHFSSGAFGGFAMEGKYGSSDTQDLQEDLNAFMSDLEKTFAFIESKYKFFRQNNAEAIVATFSVEKSGEVISLYRLYVILKDIYLYLFNLRKVLNRNKNSAFLSDYNSLRNLLVDHLNSGGVKKYKYENMSDKGRKKFEIDVWARYMALKIKASQKNISKGCRKKLDKLKQSYLLRMRTVSPLSILMSIENKLDSLSVAVQRELFLRKRDLEEISNDISFKAARHRLTTWLQGNRDNLLMEDVNVLASFHSHLRYSLEKIDKEIEHIRDGISEIEQLAEFLDLRLHFDLPFIKEELDELLIIVNEISFDISEIYSSLLYELKKILLGILLHDFIQPLAERKRQAVSSEKEFPVAPYLLSLYQEWKNKTEFTEDDIEYFLSEINASPKKDGIRYYFYKNFYPYSLEKSGDLFLEILMKDPYYEYFRLALEEMDKNDLKELHAHYLALLGDNFQTLLSLMDTLYSYLTFLNEPEDKRDDLYIVNILDTLRKAQNNESKMRIIFSSMELFLNYIANRSEYYKKKYPNYSNVISDLSQKIKKFENPSIWNKSSK